MGDDDGSQVVIPGDLPDLILDGFLDHTVQCAERLIQQQNPRFHHHGSRQRHSLLLPSGKLLDLLTLGAYLPHAFALERGGENLLSRAAVPNADDLDGLACAAAENSYAPYTGTRSGLALRTSSGRTYAGWLLESGNTRIAFSSFRPPLLT